MDHKIVRKLFAEYQQATEESTSREIADRISQEMVNYRREDGGLDESELRWLSTFLKFGQLSQNQRHILLKTVNQRCFDVAKNNFASEVILRNVRHDDNGNQYVDLNQINFVSQIAEESAFQVFGARGKDFLKYDQHRGSVSFPIILSNGELGASDSVVTLSELSSCFYQAGSFIVTQGCNASTDKIVGVQLQ